MASPLYRTCNYAPCSDDHHPCCSQQRLRDAVHQIHKRSIIGSVTGTYIRRRTVILLNDFSVFGRSQIVRSNPSVSAIIDDFFSTAPNTLPDRLGLRRIASELRIAIGGRRRQLGLGVYPVVSLEGARSKATPIRIGANDGRDVMSEQRHSRSATEIGSNVRRVLGQEQSLTGCPLWYEADIGRCPTHLGRYRCVN